MAGSPGGREVDRLAIRVLPDTSGFATTLQRVLDRIEDRAKVAVRIMPDTRGFNAELREKLGTIRTQVHVPVTPDTRAFRADLQSALAGTRARVRVPIEADASRLTAQLRSLNGASGGRVGVAVEPQLDAGALRALTARMARLARPVRIPVVLDLDAAALGRVLAGLERLARPFQVDVRTELEGEETVRAALARLSQDRRTTINVDVDRAGLNRLGASVNRIGATGSRTGRGLGAMARSVLNLRAASLTAIPNIAGLAGGLAQMAPAAGVAATGLLAMATAGAAVKIGTAGVSDALSGDAEAMAKLAPAARSTVTALRSLAPAWQSLRSSVQGALFKGFDAAVRDTATVVLPILRNSLTETASVLNTMGHGVANAVAELGRNGTLGTGLAFATTGLRNLARVPAQVVQGLGQIATAAGPSFARLTQGAGDAATRVSERLSKAFESGSLQATIERAVALAGQLFSTLGNLGTTLGNIFGPAAAAGAGFLGVLNLVSKTIAEVTGTAQAQEAFRGLFETLAAAGQVISGVLGAALRAALPLLNSLVSALAGPLQQAFAAIGPALESLVGALGSGLAPIVSAVAQVLGGQLLPIATKLITLIAETAGPILAAVGPVIGQLVRVLGGALSPILAQLPALLAPFLNLLSGQLLPTVARLATTLLTAAGPALAQIGRTFGELLKAVSPLLAALGELIGGAVLPALLAILTPIISLVGRLASIFANVLASYVTNILVPALKTVTALLRGDFSGAWQHAKEYLKGFGKFFLGLVLKLGPWVARGIAAAVRWLAGLPQRAWDALQEFGPKLRAAAVQALLRLGNGLREKWPEIKAWFRDLPNAARRAMGPLSQVLVAAGRALLRGFLNGITSMLGSVRDKLGGLTDALPDWKGPAQRDAKILRPAGRLVMTGFNDGITDAVPNLRARLRSVTDEVAAYRPTASQPAVTPRQFVASPAGGGAGVSIGTFVAQRSQTPAAIARELAWIAKARG